MRSVVTLSTCTITMPPEFLPLGRWRDSRALGPPLSMVTLPSSSAVVPRREGNVYREGFVEEVLLTVELQHINEVSLAELFILPPSRRGSTKVPFPTVELTPGGPRRSREKDAK